MITDPFTWMFIQTLPPRFIPSKLRAPLCTSSIATRLCYWWTNQYSWESISYESPIKSAPNVQRPWKMGKMGGLRRSFSQGLIYKRILYRSYCTITILSATNKKASDRKRFVVTLELVCYGDRKQGGLLMKKISMLLEQFGTIDFRPLFLIRSDLAVHSKRLLLTTSRRGR